MGVPALSVAIDLDARAGAQFDDVSLARVVFRRTVDMQGMQIPYQIALRKLVFEEDVHLEDAGLPINMPANDLTEAKGTGR